MFKDIRIFLDDETTEYTYEVKDNKIICSLSIDNDYKYLDIVYDENIYENISFVEDCDVLQLSTSKLRIELDSKMNNLVIFNVEVNYKYFIKTVYKYINNFININELLVELDIFKKTIINENYKNDINLLINEINSNLVLNNDEEKIEDLLVSNKLYLSLVQLINDRDLMLLVTYYISCEKPPKIDQITFNKLVESAIDYNYSLESVWRLAMNYDSKGYNFDLIDEFFVNSKNAWYLSEYISSIDQINQEKIVNMIIADEDKNFIKELLQDNFFQEYVEVKYKKMLEKQLEK